MEGFAEEMLVRVYQIQGGWRRKVGEQHRQRRGNRRAYVLEEWVVPCWPMGPAPRKMLWVGRNYSWKVSLGQGFWRASHESLVRLHLVGHGNGTEMLKQRRDMMRSMFWKGHSGTHGGRDSSREAATLKSHCNCLSKKSGGHRGAGERVCKQPSETLEIKNRKLFPGGSWVKMANTPGKINLFLTPASRSMSNLIYLLIRIRGTSPL